MNELIRIAKYHERWSDQRLVICVFNNRDLNMVTWEQRLLAGDPMYPASQRIPDFRPRATRSWSGCTESGSSARTTCVGVERGARRREPGRAGSGRRR